jgi:hypothetical protein
MVRDLVMAPKRPTLGVALDLDARRGLQPRQ